MNATQIVSICCLVLSIPQGISAYLQLLDRYRPSAQEASVGPSRKDHIFTAWLLLLAALGTIGLGFWIWYHPARPDLVEKKVYIHQQCPPAQQTTRGASTRGNQAPIVTGNGNTFDNGSASKPKQ